MKVSKFFSIVMFFAIGISGQNLLSQGLDSASTEALSKTQQLLLDVQKRQQAIKGDAKAEAANSQAMEAVGKKNMDEVYAISAKIFSDMVQKSNGDPEVMKQVLQQAMANPQAFFKNLSEEQKKLIRGLASKVDKGKVKKP